MRLTLNQRYREILPVSNGIDFLGYVIKQDYTLVRRRVVNNLKTKLKGFENSAIEQQSSRAAEQTVKIRYDADLINQLRATLASYWGHLKWADTYNLRSSIIERHGFLKNILLLRIPLNPLLLCESPVATKWEVQTMDSR